MYMKASGSGRMCHTFVCAAHRHERRQQAQRRGTHFQDRSTETSGRTSRAEHDSLAKATAECLTLARNSSCWRRGHIAHQSSGIHLDACSSQYSAAPSTYSESSAWCPGFLLRSTWLNALAVAWRVAWSRSGEREPLSGAGAGATGSIALVRVSRGAESSALQDRNFQSRWRTTRGDAGEAFSGARLRTSGGGGSGEEAADRGCQTLVRSLTSRRVRASCVADAVQKRE